MSNVIPFLRRLSAQPALLDALKLRSKADVIAAASDERLPFTEAEFDSEVWDLEVQLASKRGDAFDAGFGLWQTMWGQYYLEYLVFDLLSSLEEMELVSERRSEHV